MHPIEAIRRFTDWTDRTDLRRSVADHRGGDRWPEAATAACKIVGRLEAAATDEDLRGGLREFEARREYHHRLERATSDIILAHSDAAGRPLRLSLRITPRPVAPPTTSEPPAYAECETRIICITPAMAIRMFAFNKTIVRYADKMQRGEWLPSFIPPDDSHRKGGLAFHVRLSDGNGLPLEDCPTSHRLRAIALARVDVTTEVFAPPAIFDRIEQIRADLTAPETNRSNHDGNS